MKSLIEKPILAILGGTGKEGKGLALRWGFAGYEIVIGSRQMDKAKQATDELNHRLGISRVRGMENFEAARRGDICVLTVVPLAHQQVLSNLKDALQGKILIDATARIDYQDPKPPGPPSAGEQAQEILGPNVQVVAAFQNIPAKLLTNALEQPLDADVLVCSDHLEAAETVINLAEAAGMRGYYAGRLVNSNVVEGLTSILISMNKHYRIKDARIKVSGIEV